MGQDLSKLTILYVTHSLTSSPKDEWVEFLKTRCKKLIYIDHPFSYKKGDISSSITIFEEGIEIKRHCVPFSRKLSDIFFYIKDVFLNIFWTLLSGRIDLCISLDPLNTFSLLIFRKIGLIKRLIFYVIDYVPVRFPNKLKNFIYHFIDRQCCYQVDYIWNLSSRMQEGRKQKGINLSRCAPSHIVPMGVDLSRINPLPIEKIERNTIVYMGAFLHKQGIQLVLSVLPEVRQKIPNIKFIIIGIGEYESEIRRLIRDLNIEESVEIKGYIKEHTELEKILCKCAIGMATYRTDEDSFSYYADPGKVKVYLGCGLPVIITKFPLIAYEIERENAGFAIQYDEIQLKESLIRLLSDDNLYAIMRNNAVKLSKRYNWYNICKRALEVSGYSIKEKVS